MAANIFWVALWHKRQIKQSQTYRPACKIVIGASLQPIMWISTLMQWHLASASVKAFVFLPQLRMKYDYDKYSFNAKVRQYKGGDKILYNHASIILTKDITAFWKKSYSRKMKAIRSTRNHQDILWHNGGTIRQANDAHLMSSTDHHNLLRQQRCDMHDMQTLRQTSECYLLRPIQNSS